MKLRLRSFGLNQYCDFTKLYSSIAIGSRRVCAVCKKQSVQKKVLIMDSPFATPLKLPCGAQLPNALYSNTGSDNSAIVPIALFTNTGGGKTISVRRSAPNRPFICPTLHSGSRATQSKPTARPRIFSNSVQAHYVLTIAPMQATVSQVSPYKLSLQIDQTRDLLT